MKKLILATLAGFVALIFIINTCVKAATIITPRFDQSNQIK